MYVRSVFSRVVSISSRRSYKKESTKKLLEFLADMPKGNSGRIADVQRQRQQISKKSEKYAASTVYLQVLGSGTRGAPNTLYLFTDQKRYLFNCGECTQRLAHEHKVRLSKLEHIFITNKTWRNIGGLPGLSLTLQDVGVPNITLHGPEGLDTLYNATKRFVIMKDMQVTMAKCCPNEEFEDGIMNVKYVLLRDPYEEILVGETMKPVTKKMKVEDQLKRDYEKFFNDDTDYYKGPGRGDSQRPLSPDKKKTERIANKPKSTYQAPDHFKKKTEKALQVLQQNTKSATVAYICTLKKRFGTLDLAKCVEFGVKPGPLLGQLKAGLDVVLPDGRIVHSADVKTPDDPGPVFIVLEVPELSYLKESEFSAYYDDGINPVENIPSLVVHFTPPHVFHEPAYQAFLRRFGGTTRHLVLNGQNSCLGSEAVHRTQHKLHLLDPDIFPLLKDVSVPAVWTATPPTPKINSPVRLKGMEELKNKFQNIINMEGSCKGDYRPPNPGIEEPDAVKIEFIHARTLTTFHLRPRKHLDRTLEPKLHIQDYIQETMDVDGFVSSLEQFRHLVDGMRYARTASNKEYPKVVFLGTGSCIPSKTRNTSAIVVHINENSSMLLDCGEGTFSQLVRFYGPKRVNAMLRTLKAVYISHLHADHHIGLIGVLQARREAFEETGSDYCPAWLLAPGQIVTWLGMYDEQFERLRDDFHLVPNQTLLTESSSDSDASAQISPATLASIGLSALRTCYVSHCPNAFGVCLDVDQHRITYSGDTIPCDNLVNLGQDSTLLIHEATMEDELADEARHKMHSTTTQAIDVGRQMRARYTVLTHFSQRYARLPRLNSNILSGNHSVGIAFDNMQITMSDLELLPHMYPPLQLMFAEHCVEMELKAAHRANKERFTNAGTKRKHSQSQSSDVGKRLDKVTESAKTATEIDNTTETDLKLNDKMTESDNTAGTTELTTEHTSTVDNSSKHTVADSSVDGNATRPVSSLSGVSGYRGISTSRIPSARLRDTRQEVRSLSGASTPRSKSVSPVKKYSRHSTPNSGTCTPKPRAITPDKHPETVISTIHPTNSETPSVTQRNCPASLGSHKKTPATPDNHRTAVPAPEKHKNNKLDTSRVVNARSKTSNSTNRTTNEVKDVKKQPIRNYSTTLHNRQSPSHSPTVHTEKVYRAEQVTHGYGKPIIPTQNKRLTIMKASHIPVINEKIINACKDMNKTVGQKPENKCSPTATQNSSKLDIVKSKSQACFTKKRFVANIILYAIFWRFYCTLSLLWAAQPKWLMPVITAALLLWTATKSISSVSGKNTSNAPAKDRTRSPTGSLSNGKARSGPDTISYTKIKSSSNIGDQKTLRPEQHSLTRPTTPKTSLSYKNGPKSLQPPHGKEIPDIRPPFRHNVNNCKQDTKQTFRRESEIPKHCLPNHREASNESLRKTQNKGAKDPRPSALASRPTSAAAAANRSFKPQLEDIKSSLLLLNKTGSNSKPLPPVNKPRPLNENERRQMLEEAKKKFQSRGFLHDAKYDKIEGLNWITWK